MSREKLSKQEIGERIRKIREPSPLRDFAVMLEVSNSYISEIEHGKVKPSLELLNNISQLLNINMNWLLTGNGSIYREEKLSEEFGVISADLSVLFVKMKAIYNKGSFDQKARLRGTIELLYEDLKKPERGDQENEGTEPQSNIA